PALLIVFLLCKLLVLAGRHVDLSPWAIPAYIWQDCLVVLLFAGLERLVPKKTGWSLYAAAALYAAINVPVARMMSTPLTWPMLHATGGPLLDSIRHQATAANVSAMLLIALVAAIAPIFLKRMRWGLVIGLIFLAIAGASISNHVETMGRERNAFAVLVTSAFSRVEARDSLDDWRHSPDGTTDTEPLPYSGIANGKNVLVIILESAGARYLKPYGAAEDPMPTISALSERSILFENTSTVYPESIKGLMATLCSRYPAIDVAAERYASVRTPSIADVMKQHGYRTALFHSGRFMYLGMHEVLMDRGFDTLEDAGDIGGNHQSSFGIDESATVNRTLNWIDQDRSKPFFAVYMPIAGHHPYDTPTTGPYPDNDEINRYRNALHYADQSVAELLNGLRARSLERGTFLLILGDHGEAFGQHDGNFGHTNFIYQENVHVPFLIVLPALDHQIRIHRTVSLIDLPGTICDLLDVEKPAQWQGGSALRDEGMSLFLTDYSLGLLGLRDGDWKFIYQIESGRGKLFNLNEDPRETTDLAQSQPQRCQQYRNRLLNWAAAQRSLVLKGQ
ncbi:MAG TPA: sulfatase, partial [Tepidisphaeraceae bacterium]|nr:sulfatase [Tepidisphaeraceae bacterium]